MNRPRYHILTDLIAGRGIHYFRRVTLAHLSMAFSWVVLHNLVASVVWLYASPSPVPLPIYTPSSVPEVTEQTSFHILDIPVNHTIFCTAQNYCNISRNRSSFAHFFSCQKRCVANSACTALEWDPLGLSLAIAHANSSVVLLWFVRQWKTRVVEVGVKVRMFAAPELPKPLGMLVVDILLVTSVDVRLGVPCPNMRLIRSLVGFVVFFLTWVSNLVACPAESVAL